MKKPAVRLLAPFLALILSIALAPSSGGAGPAVNSASGVFYASKVAKNGYKPAGGVWAAYADPSNALGPPDVPVPNPDHKGWVSLGNAENFPKVIPEDALVDPRTCDAYLILEWEGVALYDGPGDDVLIYEVGTNSGLEGVPEPLFVFAGAGDDEWYYLGEFGKNSESFDLGASAQKRFPTIALCDRAGDGETSTYFWGGPDIDAVAALNWKPTGGASEAEPILTATANGPRNRINALLMGEQETRIVVPSDRIEVGSEIDLGWECDDAFAAILTFTRIVVDDDDDQVRLEAFLTDRALPQCEDLPEAAAAGMALDLAVTNGSAAVRTAADDLRLALVTETAAVATQGRARYQVRVDAAAGGVSTFTAAGGAITITPAGGNLKPFVLRNGYSVIVTADSVSAPFADARLFLPMLRSR